MKKILPIMLAISAAIVIVFVFTLRSINPNIHNIGAYVSLNIVMIALEMRYLYRVYKNSNNSSEGQETQNKYYNIIGTTVAILIIFSPILLIWYR